MDAKTSRRISVLGFLMSCIIVLFHAEVGWGPSNSVDEALFRFISVMMSSGCDLAMNYFFLVTGLLLFLGLTPQNLGAKLKRRVFSLLIPYLIWQVLTVIYLVIYGNAWPFSKILRAVFLLKDLPDGPLWYLYVVFLLAFLALIQLPVFRNKKAAFLCTTVFGLVLPSVLLHMPQTERIMSFGCTRAAVSYFPAYALGCFLGYFWDSKEGTDNLRYYFYFLMTGFLLDGLLDGIFLKAVMAGLPLLLLHYFPVWDTASGPGICRFSFLLYAMHGPLMGYVQGKGMQYVCSVFTWASAVSFFTRLFCLGVFILGAVLVHRVPNRISRKSLQLLTGGRC